MILVPSFDIPSSFRLGKITEECPFQGPVFFDSEYMKNGKYLNSTWSKQASKYELLLPKQMGKIIQSSNIVFQKHKSQLEYPIW